MVSYRIEQELDRDGSYEPPYCNDCGGTGVVMYDPWISPTPIYCDCEAAIFYGYHKEDKKENNE